MKQFIVINAETANKCWIWSGGSPGAPPSFRSPRSQSRRYPWRAEARGVPLWEEQWQSPWLLFFWFILTSEEDLLPDLQRLLLGSLCLLRMKEEGQTCAIIAILATIILISAHESGRLHIQVHRVMDRVEL